MKPITVAAIQLNPGADIEHNIKRAAACIEKAQKRGATFIVLPELFLYRGPRSCYEEIAKVLGGPATSFFARCARKYGSTIVLGSILEASRHRGKCFNTSLVISSQGKIVARYRKKHLFDATVGGKRIEESRYFCSGKTVATARVGGVSIGLAICFDLRFPELFQTLMARGTHICCVPSNFTRQTGKAHWQTLVKARAIETQQFVIAPNLCGIDPATKVPSYGHSLIVDPWGTVLAEAGEKEAVLVAKLNLNDIEKVKKRMPLRRR